MKTKTTIYKFHSIFYLNITRFNSLIFDIFSKKLQFLTIKNTLILFLIFSTTIAFGQSGCNADLVVENNGNIRSTPLDGTYYSMILTNKGNSSDTYTLASLNINSTCSNNDGSSASNNVIINTDFIDPNKNAINEITVDSGQSVNFYVHITVPIGTIINKWSCTQIIAESKTCANYKVSTILHTYVINPSND